MTSLNPAPWRNFGFLMIIAAVSFFIYSCNKKTEEDPNTNDTPPPAAVVEIEGISYHTLKIGNQYWMVENLKVTLYKNGNAIENVKLDTTWANLTTGGYCDYENEPANSLTYGRLYNWFAVNDNRAICPAGWHVPTNDEWFTLTNLLGGDEVAAGKLKEAGTAHWDSPNEGATNETGFTALPGGYRDADGSFSDLGFSGDWWSSTQFIPGVAWERFLEYRSPGVYTHGNAVKSGFSVRCIWDGKSK